LRSRNRLPSALSFHAPRSLSLTNNPLVTSAFLSQQYRVPPPRVALDTRYSERRRSRLHRPTPSPSPSGEGEICVIDLQTVQLSRALRRWLFRSAHFGCVGECRYLLIHERR